MRVSIVIPTLNRPDLLTRCLDSLDRQTLGELELIVVDNGSHPPVAAAPPAHLESRLIRFERNMGFSYAVNCGLGTARGEFVLVLNDDVELEPEYIERLADALAREPKAAFASGKLLRARERDVIDGAGDAILLGGGAYRLGHGEKDIGQYTARSWVISACAAAALYRRQVIEQVGGFDEQFFAYLEDVDLGLRAQWAGYRGLYVPEAVAYHHGSATLGPDDPRILAWITRNQLFLLGKNFSAGMLFRCAPRIVVFQFLWALRLLAYGFFGAYLHGLAGAIAGLPRMLGHRREVKRLRQITPGEFLQSLRASEYAIFEAEQRRPPGDRSRLLRWYFNLCGKPRDFAAAARPTTERSAGDQLK